MKIYSSKSNARRAALAELGPDSAQGLDYNLIQHGKRNWAWEQTAAAQDAEDARDATIAEARLKEIDDDPSQLVSVQELDSQLEQLIASAPRAGTKEARVITMIERPAGASLAEIMKVTGWQPHTVRAMISAALKKKRGLTVISERNGDGERVYRIPAAA